MGERKTAIYLSSTSVHYKDVSWTQFCVTKRYESKQWQMVHDHGTRSLCGQKVVRRKPDKLDRWRRHCWREGLKPLALPHQKEDSALRIYAWPLPVGPSSHYSSCSCVYNPGPSDHSCDRGNTYGSRKLSPFPLPLGLTVLLFICCGSRRAEACWYCCLFLSSAKHFLLIAWCQTQLLVCLGSGNCSSTHPLLP